MRAHTVIWCISIGLLMQASLGAAEELFVVERLSSDPGRLPRLLDQVRSARSTPCATPFASIDLSTNVFIIPAAGSLAGAGGTFFRSDVTFINFDVVEQRLAVLWLGRDAGIPDPPSFAVTLPPNGMAVTIEDFVSTRLALSGLGALLVVAVNAQGQFDGDSSIDGTSRIWTTQPGSSGSVSQMFRAVDLISLFLEDDAISLGLRHDDRFRTNIGIVNVDEVPRTFQLTITGERFNSQMMLTVPASSMSQVPVPAGNYGALSVLFRPPADAPQLIWAAYGTTVDNVTGDSWASMAAAIYPPESSALSR